MNTIKTILKRYYLFLISSILLTLLSFVAPCIIKNTFNSAKLNFLQMLTVLPPIMILLGLMDVWIPRKKLMKYMGNNSKILGVFLAMLIGSLAAGPMYAAFPFAEVLIKKNVKFTNVIIFMNAWCVTKISTLLFEVSALGYRFTILRLLIDIPGVIIMSYLVNYFMDKNSIDTLYINKAYSNK